MLEREEGWRWEMMSGNRPTRHRHQVPNYWTVKTFLSRPTLIGFFEKNLNRMQMIAHYYIPNPWKLWFNNNNDEIVIGKRIFRVFDRKKCAMFSRIFIVFLVLYTKICQDQYFVKYRLYDIKIKKKQEKMDQRKCI